MNTETVTVTIDKSNLYVQTLLKIFNEFLLEEAAGKFCPENRLIKKIEQAQNIFRSERVQLEQQCKNSPLPIFGYIDFSKYRIEFK